MNPNEQASLNQNHPTQQVIAFLSDPEVSLADAADLPLLLADTEELRQAVEAQLEAQLEAPRALSSREAASLRARLDEVDWPLVAREFQSRLDLAAGFFDPDAQAHRAT